jgi:uncharacterized protein (TIGR03435 family)
MFTSAGTSCAVIERHHCTRARLLAWQLVSRGAPSPFVAGECCYKDSTMKMLALAMGFAAVHTLVGAQTPSSAPTTFDVVSVRRNVSGGGGAGFQIFPGGQFRATNASVRQLIQSAFDFQYERFQFVGGPAWIDVERYDVQAAPAAQSGRVATAQEIAARVQELLKDRFKLVMRRETREMQRYDLVVARAGRLKANAGTCAPRAAEPKAADDARPYCGFSFPPDSGDVQHIVATGVRISDLSRRLQQSVEAIVVDNTGLTGTYDFTLDYLRARNLGDQQAVAAGVSIFTALQEQLGLRLEPRRGPVEVVVIEQVERPSDN